MPTSMQIVRSVRPNVKRIVLSKTPLAVEVSESDIKGATPKDPMNCAMARACKRQLGVDAAMIGFRTSYLIKGDTAMMYATSTPIRREQTSFDRGAAYAPGHYNLAVPRERLPRGSGTRHAGDPRPGRISHVFYPHVAGVRAELDKLVPLKKKRRPKKKH